MGLGLWPSGPGNAVVLRLERTLDHPWVVVQDLVVEVAPHQLGQPAFGAFGSRLRAVPGLPRQLADRYGAKSQVGRQVARAFDRRKVPRAAIVVHAVDKVAQQLLRPAHAGGHPDLVGGHRLEPNVAHRRQWALHRLRQRRQRARQGARLMRFERLRMLRQTLEPGVLVRREHAIGPAGLRHHLAPLEHHMVLHADPLDALPRQCLQHLAIPGKGLRLVVMAGHHPVHAERRCQGRDFLDRAAMPHDQTHPIGIGYCASLGPSPQRRVDFGQGSVDEGHTLVSPRQRLQDIGVVNEGTPHAPGATQGVVQRRVVVASKVAAQPNQRAVKGFRVHPPQYRAA